MDTLNTLNELLLKSDEAFSEEKLSAVIDALKAIKNIAKTSYDEITDFQENADMDEIESDDKLNDLWNLSFEYTSALKELAKDINSCTSALEKYI